MKKQESENSPLVESISESWLALLRFYWYYRTRKAVFNSLRIVNMTWGERYNSKLLGPWTFGIQRITIATLPGLTFLALVNYVLGDPKFHEYAEDFEHSSAEVTTLAQIYTSNNAILLTLIPVLLYPVYVILAAISFNGIRDYSVKNLLRSRDLILYCDGAFGLWPLLLMLSGGSITMIFQERPRLAEVFPVWIHEAIAIIAYAGLVAVILTYLYVIPKAIFLFTNNDLKISWYRPDVVFVNWAYLRYLVAIVVVIVPVYTILFNVLIVISSIGSYLIVWARTLFA